jgi:hypothetical protein
MDMRPAGVRALHPAVSLRRARQNCVVGRSRASRGNGVELRAGRCGYAVVSADEAHGRTSPFRASAEAVGPAARARFRRALPGQKWGRWGPKAEEQLRESPVTTPRCMTDSRSRSCAADQHPLPRKLFPACSRRSPRTWPGQRVDASRHPRRTPSSPVPVDRGGCQEGARTMSTPSTTPSRRR